MGIYETTYILHPALQEGRLNDIIRTVEKKAESLGAEILFSDNWGRKKLAYLIDKEKYGTYIFFQYKLSDLNNLKELNGEFEHNPNILRYLNIKIEEEDIMQANKKENVSTESIDDKKEDKSNKPENDKENVGEKE
tara:strand:- start:816 stop:1223 length:408 start_codon:yes stop_codon:yes gene_type:complete